MKRRVPLIAVGIGAPTFTLQAGLGLSGSAVRKRLRNGALLIDDHTIEESSTRHLTKAINLRLDELKQTLPCRVPYQGEVLLPYCRSGRRGGIAERALREMSYTKAFNLGSFEQARKVANSRSP